MVDPLITLAMAMMKAKKAKECGPCTLCCKVLRIPEFPDKETDRYCQHAKKSKGCQIYRDRPSSCREFECLWLRRSEFGPEFYPLRSHIVMDIRDPIEYDGKEVVPLLLHVDPNFGAAYRQPYFTALANKWPGPVFALIGKHVRRAINPMAVEMVQNKVAELPLEDN